MRFAHLLLAAPLLIAAPVAGAARPVEVTRFHTPETMARLAPGWVVVAPAPGIDPDSLETRIWLNAVAGELARHGFSAAGSGEAARVAEVRLTRHTVERGITRGPSPSVGVGIGVGSGGWHGGAASVGLGIGIGGGSARRELVASELSVVIRDARTRAPLWEGRAVTSARSGSPEAAPAATARRLAQALFAGFPGRSGETIEVR